MIGERPGMTAAEVAARLGLTVDQVRRLERSALRKLRLALEVESAPQSSPQSAPRSAAPLSRAHVRAAIQAAGSIRAAARALGLHHEVLRRRLKRVNVAQLGVPR